MDAYALDYQVVREPLRMGFGFGLCGNCRIRAAAMRLTVNRVERGGKLAREWERHLCEQCGDTAHEQARAECQHKLYPAGGAWKGAA